MYQYKFFESRKPIDTKIHSEPIPGYINFVGHAAADADGNVDWTKWDCIDPETKTLVAVTVVVPDPYVPTLDEVKIQRKAYIKQRRNQEEAKSPFEYDSSLFDYDPLSRERINSAVVGSAIAAMNGIAANTVVAEWRLWDNTEKEMTVGNWLGFKQAEIARSAECFNIASSLKGAIDSAETANDVLSIDWPAYGNDSY